MREIEREEERGRRRRGIESGETRIEKMSKVFDKQFKIAAVILCLTLVAQCSPIVNHSLNHTNSLNNAHEEVYTDGESAKLGLYNMFGGGNPNLTPKGEQLIEGDIVLSSNSNKKNLSDSSLSSLSFESRKAIPDTSVYWPNGEVVYTYHESINQAEMNVIEAAMNHWRQHTCITFRPRQANDYLFVRFRSDTQGCWSLVGRQADRIGQGQDVSIGTGCANLNVVVHEIGHVIGFYHEQSRSDRDQYIDIVWSNVLPGYGLQFRKESDSNYNIPYDLTSTMQYPQWAFSKEIFEKSTIVSRNPAYQRFLSKNYPLSFRDRLLANQLYSCTVSCSGSCSNGGYMRATGGGGYGGLNQQACSCDCPPNYSGLNCETKIREDYYDTLPCGGIIDKEGRIETPNYPQRLSPYQSCMWDIRAPMGSTVGIKIEGFEFAPRFTKPGTKVINKCFNETVEIRLKNGNIYDGDAYCGTDLTPGTVLKSDGPRAVIIITANDKMYGRGMSAKVKFLKNGGSGESFEEKEDEEKEKEPIRPITITPPTQIITTESTPSTTTPNIFTFPPIVPVVNTLPPILPPQPPPPPSVVTTSSLLEEYEKESKKTLPPVGPY